MTAAGTEAMNHSRSEHLVGWNIERIIGRGGFKTVFLVEKDGLKEALKVTYLRDADVTEPTEVAQLEHELHSRAEREFQLLSQYQGGSVVSLGCIPGHLSEWDGTPAHIYSEELLLGQTLDMEIRSNNTSGVLPSWSSIRALYLAGLEILERIWADKIVHRDIKPQNIMATSDPMRPFVFFDLGIAFEREGSSLTRATLGPGTLIYRAPETLDADYRANIDFRCDLFSLALSVSEYATGKHPIHQGAMGVGDTVYRLLKKQAEPLGTVRTDLPSEFCSIIDRCLHKKPALRPVRFAELRKIGEV